MERAQRRWFALKAMYEEATETMEAKAHEQEALIKYLEKLAGEDGS